MIAGTIGGTVLAGVLALIAWRVTTDFYDKMEYEKFERERHLAHWGRVSSRAPNWFLNLFSLALKILLKILFSKG